MCDNDAVCANLNANVEIKTDKGIKSVEFTADDTYKNGLLDKPRYLSTAVTIENRPYKKFYSIDGNSNAIVGKLNTIQSAKDKLDIRIYYQD